MAAASPTRKRKASSGSGASPVRRKRAAASSSNGGTPRSPIAKAKKATGTQIATATAKKALVPSGRGSHMARRLALMAAKKVATRAAHGGVAGLRTTALRIAEHGRGIAQGTTGGGLADQSRGIVQRVMTPSVPVQRSIDVAVPLRVAWAEWMKLETLPEGAHRVHEIERDGDELYGRVDAKGQPEWRAEIVDEREEDSFAWRSVEGSDCAGLITFHRLSDKLTRLELDLDALPTSPAEAVALNTPLAQRRTELELRRFKAHVEFMNPDDYEQDDTE